MSKTICSPLPFQRCSWFRVSLAPKMNLNAFFIVPLSLLILCLFTGKALFGGIHSKPSEVESSLIQKILERVSPLAYGRAVPPWSKAKKPSSHLSQSLGSYADGCLQGGQILAPQGPGYVSIRRFRNRFYAHPSTLEVISTLGKWVKALGMRSLEIGDLSQPRGGLMTYGHRSHQNGLDVDIWFGYSQEQSSQVKSAVQREKTLFKKTYSKKHAVKKPNKAQRKKLKQMKKKHEAHLFDLQHPSVLMTKREKIDPKKWSNRHLNLLYLATQDARVERIFVHWQIKAKLCALYKAKKLSSTLKASQKLLKKEKYPLLEDPEQWLRKIRPWYGHHQHFHIRLRCPPKDSKCLSQKTIALNSGCDQDLAWFSLSAKRKRKKEQQHKEKQDLEAREIRLSQMTIKEKTAFLAQEKKDKKQRQQEKQKQIRQKKETRHARCAFLTP